MNIFSYNKIYPPHWKFSLVEKHTKVFCPKCLSTRNQFSFFRLWKKKKIFQLSRTLAGVYHSLCYHHASPEVFFSFSVCILVVSHIPSNIFRGSCYSLYIPIHKERAWHKGDINARTVILNLKFTIEINFPVDLQPVIYGPWRCDHIVLIFIKLFFCNPNTQKFSF